MMCFTLFFSTCVSSAFSYSIFCVFLCCNSYFLGFLCVPVYHKCVKCFLTSFSSDQYFFHGVVFS
jgi:hypothetical protein